MPTFRIETDQGTFDIDADREPTQEEALKAISGANAQPSAPVSPTPEFDQFRKAFIKQEQAPTLDQVIEAFKAPVKGIAGMVSDIAGIPAGLREASAAQSPAMVTSQSIAEGARRTGIDTLNLAQLVAQEILKNAIAAKSPTPAGIMSGGIQRLIEGFKPRTPSEQEVEAAFFEQENLKNQLSPESTRGSIIFPGGQISEDLAQGVRAVIPLLNAPGEAASLAKAGAKGTARRLVETAETMKKRGYTKPPLLQEINKATGLTSLDNSIQKAAIWKSSFEEAGIPTKNIGAVEALESIPKAQDFLINKTVDGLKLSEKNGGIFNGDGAFISGRQSVLDEFPSVAKQYAQNPEILDGIMKELDFVKGQLTPLEGQRILKELNKRYKSLVDKNSPQAYAYRAVRNSMSDQLDSLWRNATGVNDSPYRNWGVLEEISDGLETKIRSAENLQAAPTKEGASLTVAELGAKAGRKLARPLIPLRTETLDTAVRRILKESPKPQISTPPVINP